MPLNKKGKEIMSNMRKEYGDRAEQVFYASKNAGKIKGVEGRSEAQHKHIKKLAK